MYQISRAICAIQRKLTVETNPQANFPDIYKYQGN